MIKKWSIFIFLFLACFFHNAIAQNGNSRDDLQKQAQSLQRELDDLNRLLDQTKKNKKSSLAQLAVIRNKISKREALINGIAKQVKLLDAAIQSNQQDVRRLNNELDTLKYRYAKSIVFAYQSRSGYEYLNFLFSAGSFNDAVKRITYLKSYRQNREAQAMAIGLSEQNLKSKINVLSENKQDRLKTLSAQTLQLKVLQDDRKEQDKVIKQLKSKEQEITTQVRQKEAQRRKMQTAIAAIIKREMLEAQRKENERLAKLKAANAANNKTTASTDAKPNSIPSVSKVEGGLKSTTSNRPYSALETTEEGRETSISFENNKGGLPWPVASGIVNIRFGVESIPGTKLDRKSDGIEVAVPRGTAVKSVANGVVVYVGDVNGDKTVLIKHGKYFTAFSCLSSATVSSGQEVKAGTVIGRSGINLDGEGAVLFSICNEKAVYYDPENWLKPKR
ncbi:MAG: murein hydrolase activator EnvC family protein [Sediminibacterium sp.]